MNERHGTTFIFSTHDPMVMDYAGRIGHAARRADQQRSKEIVMKFIISLAFKNLTRYKRRTMITAGAIAVGIMMFIMVDSMLAGAEYESVRNLKWYETSSVRIYKRRLLGKPLSAAA